MNTPASGHLDLGHPSTDTGGLYVTAAAGVAFSVAVLLALPTLFSFFVADDFVSLYSVTTTQPWEYLYSNWLGRAGEGGFYRPVFNWGLGICYLPLGLNPLPFRLSVILLYGVNSALVVWIAHKATGSRAGAMVAGLVFAAHPAYGEAVGWISALLEQLCAVFFLSSVLFFDRAARKYPENNHRMALTLSVVCMALSLGSKEMGIVIPAIVVYWDWNLHRPRWGRRFIRGALSRIRLWLPFVVLALAYLAMRVTILGGIGGYGTAKHFNFGVADNHLVHYLYFLLDPLPTTWLDRSAGGKALTVALAAIVGAAGYWRFAGLPRCRGALLGGGWFLICWLPVSTLLRTQYLFLPSIGFAVAVGAVLGPLVDVGRHRESDAVRLLVGLGLLGWLLFAGNALLKQFKLWEAGGQITQSVLRQTPEVAGELESGAVIIYENLPVNIGVPVFQHGIQEGLRLYLNRADIEAMRVRSFRTLPSHVDPQRAYFLRYDKGLLRNKTGEVRGSLGEGPGEEGPEAHRTITDGARTDSPEEADLLPWPTSPRKSGLNSANRWL